MDSKSRARHIQSSRETVVRNFEDHVSRLYQLESECGVDLDVLTDVYGTGILDNTEASSRVLKQWESLIEGIRSSADYLVIAQHFPKPSLIRSSGRDRPKELATRFTLVDLVNKPYITYIKGDGERTDSSIRLDDASVLTLQTDDNQGIQNQQWQKQPLLLAKPHFTGFIARPENRYFADGILNALTGTDAGIVAVSRGEDIFNILGNISTADYSAVFAIRRIAEELQQTFA